MKKNNYVLIQYLGDEKILARLESCGGKVEFQNGDVHFATAERANALCSAYNFELVDPLAIDMKMIETAKKRLEKSELVETKVVKERKTKKHVEVAEDITD